jgi:S-adenosylmethionine decarboxylase
LIDFLACILFLKRIEIVLMMFKVTDSLILPCLQEIDVLMESKGGKKSSSSRSMMYEAPLGYSIEDVRPAGGVKKFQSAAYSNVRISYHSYMLHPLYVLSNVLLTCHISFTAVREEAILISLSCFPVPVV